MKLTLAAVVIGLHGVGGCASAPVAEAPVAESPKPPSMMQFDEFGVYETAPGVYFAGQPAPEALAQFKAAGGKTVINLRTEQELAFLPYYEPAQAGYGFEYTNVPCSGSTMGRAEYDAFLVAYQKAQGPVLLHCRSSGRARMMWAAYEQEELGLSRERVLANAAARGQDSEKSQASIDAMLDRVAGITPPEPSS